MYIPAVTCLKALHDRKLAKALQQLFSLLCTDPEQVAEDRDVEPMRNRTGFKRRAEHWVGIFGMASPWKRV